MNTIGRNMDRRSFLKLPALLPLTALHSEFTSAEYHFQYEWIVGTALALTDWPRHYSIAECACRAVLEEVDRLTSILNTRDPTSEISLMRDVNDRRHASKELREVLEAYDLWELRTAGVFSMYPNGRNMPPSIDAL